MSVSIKDVEHIAKLAKFEINDEEKELYCKNLDTILSWIDKLSEIDTSNVEPTAHVLGIKNVLRDDKAKQFENVQAVLSNVPIREFNFVKVKKVIES